MEEIMDIHFDWATSPPILSLCTSRQTNGTIVYQVLPEPILVGKCVYSLLSLESYESTRISIEETLKRDKVTVQKNCCSIKVGGLHQLV